MYGLLSILLWVGTAMAQDPTLGPGDHVNVEVHGHDFGSSALVVGSDGEISFPYVGKVVVGGLTCFEAEEVLRTALMDGYLVDPQITVRVEGYRNQRVDVIGAVKSTGQYYLDGPTTVRTIVAKAGGAQLERSSGVVYVTRSGVTKEIPLDSIEGSGGDFILLGGDVIDVDLGRAIFLTGEVANPGTVSFSPGLTISEAIIKAGGESKYSNLAGTYIVRDEERIHVNLKRILKGKASDLALAPGDRIVVPMSAL